ncbi:polysaccharide pyruvyl transferase family protein [Syntrophotalea acetylenica]|uniref:Polysaccharide pyruvyl transferase domain-containing protein n=1 Tax=Syntrophotalea acetylenica TaxID=29542 RepID=A0A1L3GHT6_SYNAC|nr:polysaccharide pyruvyl transferase family protein [Syntrophotalea acetylenica]APG25502.1 hypothetical protein A7E75_11075 [Syntrophotalea acetylenica]APG43567.1 hypothetical protein A6070_05085 [Syntrophotalea acetylenica]
MPKISVICAPAPRPNPGMASVDFAFHALSRRHGFADRVAYYQLYTADELHARADRALQAEIHARQSLPFAYRGLRQHLQEIFHSDKIVFWGDFLHSADYHQSAARRLVKIGVTTNAGAALDWVRDHYFLRHAPAEIWPKVMAFGGNLLFNRPEHYLDAGYGAEVRRFFRQAAAVRMRDVYSAAKISELRDDYSTNYLGCDCSLLLLPEDLEALPCSDWHADIASGAGRAGIFFGRNKCRPALMARFARELCYRLGVRGQWLPWGLTKGFGRMREKIRFWFPGMEVLSHTAPPTPGDLYRMLGRYQLVISDTYHVCVNAWRLGVPAVCIGQALVADADNINSGSRFAWRDKRQVFYGMNDALEYYVYAEELEDRRLRRQRLEQLTSLLQNAQYRQSVHQRILSGARAMEKAVVGALLPATR